MISNMVKFNVKHTHIVATSTDLYGKLEIQFYFLLWFKGATIHKFTKCKELSGSLLFLDEDIEYHGIRQQYLLFLNHRILIMNKPWLQGNLVLGKLVSCENVHRGCRTWEFRV